MSQTTNNIWEQPIVKSTLQFCEVLNSCPPESLRNMDALARHLGIEVEHVKTFPPKVSGHIASIQGVPYILINSRKHPKHQEFTKAHEIIHFLRDYGISELKDVNSVEFQAELLSWLLIMRTEDAKNLKEYLEHNRRAASLAVGTFVAGGGILLVCGIIKLLIWISEK